MTASCSLVSTPSATIVARPARGELLERAQDAVRRVVEDAALDQRQVDLDDVEVDLAQEPQAGVAGADVVRREAHPGPPTGGRVAPQLLQVLDLLALGQLDDQLLRADAAAAEDRGQLDRVELVGLERARREVDAQVDARVEAVDARRRRRRGRPCRARPSDRPARRRRRGCWRRASGSRRSAGSGPRSR